MNKGYTVIEILIVIFIAGIIIAVVGGYFNNFLKIQALNEDYISVAALIDQAKSSSINSKLASQYGVFFSSSTAVLFKGSNYVASSSDNQVYFLNSQVNISGINLVGSTTDRVIFSRLTGQSSASGTVTISLKNSSTSAKVIRVYQTGTIEYK